MNAEIFIPITFFAMVAAIVIVPGYFKSQERARLQDTLRVAIEKGAPIPPEVITALTSDVKPPPSPYRDLRTGLIWLGIAVGFAGLGFAVSFDEPDALMPMLGVASFPAFIGLAFVVISALGRNKKA